MASRSLPRGCPQRLAPDAQPPDQIAIAALVLALHIIEQAAALADELKQPAARVVVVFMSLEMFRQVSDSFRENGDLNLGRTRIFRDCGIFLNERGFALGCNRHRSSPSGLALVRLQAGMLKTRTGCSSPRSTSPMAMRTPREVA